MKTIWKKILPWYFEAVRNGSKTFEIRKDEDEFAVGDHIILCEWSGTAYTGFTLEAEVTYILRDAEQYGLMNGFCILGIKALEGKDTNVPTWIPVSERMPESADCPMDCLVTRKSKTIGNYTDMAVAEKGGTWTHEDWEAIVLGDNVSGKKTGLLNTRGDEIVAWMPQVEPWKGEEHETD